MNKPLSGMKIAVLAASGFEENHLITMQKALKDTGAILKVISSDTGVIGGMSGQGWGHNHAVDAPLNTALGVDYEAVIIPGGKSSHEKLKKTAHTKRFVGSFQASQKPVIAIGDAIELLDFTGQMNNDVLSGEELSDAFMNDILADLMNNMEMDEAA